MARSPFYARIKRDVLAIIAVVPEGRLVTFADVGRHLDVAPRHAAYILTTLDAVEADGYPWHRAVAESGRLDPPKVDRLGRSQAERLAAEGLRVGQDERLSGLSDGIVAVAVLPHGVPFQKRPDEPRESRSRRLRTP